MSFLVDTNVLSELRKGHRADAGVREWVAGVTDDSLHVSVLVLGELRRGAERLGRRDPRAAAHVERWLSAITERYEDRIVPIDARIADLSGRLNVPDPLPVVDGLLAATALVHDFVLVTRNVADVAGTGARVLDPFARR